MDVYLNEMVRYLFAQSWQIALLTVAVAVLTFALRRRSAHVRYLLWLIVLAKCLVPPLHVVPLRVLPEAMPEMIPSILSPSVSGHEPLALPGPAASDVPNPQRPQAIPSHDVPPDSGHSLSVAGWLGVLWVAGTAAYLLMNLLRALRGHYWLHATRRPLPEDLRVSTANLLRAYGVRHLPRIWMMEGVGQPFVWGLLRGSIYVPLGFPRIESPEHRRDILAHELSHVLRFDAAVNTLQIVAQGLFWFHPLVWWANRRIRQEREKCCDEMAIARFGAGVKSYSRAIIDTIAQARQSRRPIPSLAVAGSLKHIEERIKTMLTPGKRFYKRPSLITASIIFLAAFVTVPTALVLTARAQTEPPKAKANSPRTLHQAAAAGDVEQVRKLLAQGADVHAKDEDGRTPLHRAAWHARKDVVEVLLARGANVNEVDGSGRTPLHAAANFGETAVPELLLAHGAQIDARDKAGNTPLHAAADQVNVVKGLLEFLVAKGADVEARNEAGQTPLHRVSSIGRLDRHLERTAEALLALGAEIDAKDQSGRTPLHLAAGTGHRELVNLLLAKGADIEAKVDAKDKSGYTPLHFVVENGHKDLVDLLVAKGADIEAKTATGRTALHLAMFDASTCSDMVALLVNHGADVNSVDSNGITPLHLAAGRGATNETVERLIAKGADVNAKGAHGAPALLAAMYGHRDTVTLLLSKGADTSIQLAAYLGDLARVKGFLANGVGVNTQDANSVTPLHAAARGGQKEVVEFLLSKGASVNADSGDFPCGAPLHCAAVAGAGSKEVAELLIEKGAEIDAKNKGGVTPLFSALSVRNTDTARLLIAHGADVNAKSQNGWTPLHYAARSGSKDLVLLLLDHGADVNAEIAPKWRPLDYAVVGGHKDVAKLLIDKGADTVNQDSLLYSACWQVDKDLAELVIRKGANVSSQAENYAPILAALWGGYGRTATKPADIPRLLGVLGLLLDRGADPDAKDRWDWSLLHYACGNVDLTKLLLDRGANPNVATGWRGLTPLHFVADEGNKAVTQLLLSRGADVNAKDVDGHTPLLCAENLGGTNMWGEPRKTPLTAEVKAAKQEVARILREHGAKE